MDDIALLLHNVFVISIYFLSEIFSSLCDNKTFVRYKNCRGTRGEISSIAFLNKILHGGHWTALRPGRFISLQTPQTSVARRLRGC